MKAKLAWALLIATAVVVSAGAPASSQQAVTVLTQLRHETSDSATRLIVEGSGAVAYTYYSPDPLTLVVDMPDIDASKLEPRLSVGSREVDSVRISQSARDDGKSLARMEVHLASVVPYQIFANGNTLQLIFERAKPLEVETPTATSPAKSASGTAHAVPGNASENEHVENAGTASVNGSDDATKASNGVPADYEAAALSAPVGPVRKASRILSVTHSMEGERLAVTVHADGGLRYQDFFLGNPDRLVLDFSDVVSRAPIRSIELQREPVRRVRLAQFSVSSPKVARLVLDLVNRSPYRIIEGSDGIKILFGEGQTPAPAPLAALKSAPAPAAEGSVAAAPMNAAEMAVVQEPPPAPAPLVTPAAPIPPAVSALTGQKPYTGHPISLDFKDGDLQDIFRLFADISGLNVVVNPGITGKVTLKLTEVPWDQALDLILKTNGLGYTLEDNVIRIAKLTDLQREEQDKRKLAEERALAGDLKVTSKRLSYAKAAELEPTVRKVALSARGTITLDTRTNTMILTDLPANIARAEELIVELDRATPQVEIEARIVVTSRNFTRDLGVQWGFNQQRTPGFANTIDRAFPYSMILNGQGVPSTGGLPADQSGQATAAGIGQGTRGYAVNLPASGFNTALGISMGNIVGNFNIDAALTALERQGRGRLLSTPKVTTQNNLSAEIKQGVQIPIQTIANNTVTVSFKDAVLTLKVTPQITEAGTVILLVEVENNAADFANLVNGIPPINTQSAKTTVLVKDGSTAVIGGIYQSNEQTSQASTPFLGRLPILGYLFRNRFVTSSNNELLLFITPRIIKG